ncbi:CBF/Mak21 family-domain-containing protein [Polychytrium aggregatum]|uniref:CBF/Mak21 family-domain-containing protein n=1 Tax=Polychytrium aggregatum TaxID=110093 RepID=UPI0022FF0F28|nr:CBF/Mak21 family-domain-containing protein [Polychytrium aggregatum]KAI9203164.1 CBF/Mak21 family-domain-containing protein [Polychytrium aggregatum]
MSKPSELAKEALASTKSLNNIVSLLQLCESTSQKTSHDAIVALAHVFVKLFERGEFLKPQLQDSSRTTVLAPKVVEWLKENLLLFNTLLIGKLDHKEPAIQIAALSSLVKIIKHESENLSKNEGCWCFYNQLYQRVVEALVNVHDLNEHLLKNWVQLVDEYDDLRFYFYKNLTTYVTELNTHKQTSGAKRSRRTPTSDQTRIMQNGFEILKTMQSVPIQEDDINSFLCEAPFESKNPDKKDKPKKKKKAPKIRKPTQSMLDVDLDFGLDDDIGLDDEEAEKDGTRTNPVQLLSQHKKVFGECWVALLRLPLTEEIYKRTLLIIHKKIIPNMNRPAHLIDFLTDSYNAGGAVSLLALNGLFTLIQEHGLDYPSFFPKLYALLDRNIMFAKHRSRFFRLLDLFLSSTHLPSYLVAAFIKRLARLALTAPPAGTVIIIPFIYNLLRRHPSTIQMIHVDGGSSAPSVETDVYDFAEPDPAKCHALDSCLWELQALKSHYMPSISGLARTFEEPLSKPSYDLEDFLDHTYQSMFDAEIKRRKVDESVPLAIVKKDEPLFAASAIWQY